MSERTLFEEVLDDGLRERCKRVKMGCIYSFQQCLDSLRDKGLSAKEVFTKLDEYLLDEKQQIDSEYPRFKY